MRVKVICPCGNEFETDHWRRDSGRGKYCSKKCKYGHRKMPKRGVGSYTLVKHNPTSFSKGNVPWNNNTRGKGVCKPSAGSIKKGQRRGMATEFKKGGVPVNFKGGEVGYFSLHVWIKRHKGAPQKCKHCGSETNVQWANISHEYKRDLEDFMELCAKCHKKYDKETMGVATKKFNLNKK